MGLPDFVVSCLGCLAAQAHIIICIVLPGGPGPYHHMHCVKIQVSSSGVRSQDSSQESGVPSQSGVPSPESRVPSPQERPSEKWTISFSNCLYNMLLCYRCSPEFWPGGPTSFLELTMSNKY